MDHIANMVNSSLLVLVDLDFLKMVHNIDYFVVYYYNV